MPYPVLYFIQKSCKKYRRLCLINLLGDFSMLCLPFMFWYLSFLNFTLVYVRKSATGFLMFSPEATDTNTYNL